MTFANMLQAFVAPQSIINNVTYKGDSQHKHILNSKEPKIPTKIIASRVSNNIYCIQRVLHADRYEVRIVENRAKHVIYSGTDLDEAIRIRDLWLESKPRKKRHNVIHPSKYSKTQKYSSKVVSRGVFEIFYSGASTPIYRAIISIKGVRKIVYNGTDKDEAIRIQAIEEANKPKQVRLPTSPLNMVKSTMTGIRNIWTDLFGYRYLVKTGRSGDAVVHYYGSDINAAEQARRNYELSR